MKSQHLRKISTENRIKIYEEAIVILNDAHARRRLVGGVMLLLIVRHMIA